MTVALIGIPYDGSSSFQPGAAEAPPAIRRAFRSDSSNTWSEDLKDIGAPGAFHDAGDLPVTSSDVRAEITSAIARLLEQGMRPFSLGGDHSISYPILRAIRAAHPRLTVLHLDAHSDLYDEYQGDRFSHACPFARVMEERLADRLIQVGIRTLSVHQREQAQRFGVEMLRRDEPVPQITTPLYLSLDLDVLDPAFAPGLSHPEPGGLSTREVIGLIQGITAPLVGADIVEYNPRNDVRDLTGRVAAKLLKEIIAKMGG